MYTFLLVIHVLAAILLIVTILIQRGRGGGLVESFSGVESMFGAKTSVFLTRLTTVFAVIFLFTSISLAFLAARQSRSLIQEEEAPAVGQVEIDVQPEEILPQAEDENIADIEIEKQALPQEQPLLEEKSLSEQPVEESPLPIEEDKTKAPIENDQSSESTLSPTQEEAAKE